MDDRTLNHIRRMQKGLFVFNSMMFVLISYLHLVANGHVNHWVSYAIFILSLLSLAFHFAIRMHIGTGKTTTEKH